MAIEFECPSCRARIRTPDEAAGKKARCPTCQQISAVPLTSTFTSPTFPSQSAFGGGATLPSSQPPQSTSFEPSKPGGTFQPPLGPTPPPASAPPAWLPPSDAFAPQGPPQFGPALPQPTSTNPPPPQSNNPFGDYAPVNSGPATINPYQSPTGYGQISNSPYDNNEVRGKLLGPALGITICALISLAAVIMLAVAIYMDPEFHEDMQEGGDPTETMFAYLFVTLFLLGGALPAIIALIGAVAMFRGRGLVAAWIGAIASVLPCTPCFIISAGFAIWGMVNLNDPRVNAGMK